ncbi:craniofacial development protein 2 [Biomphalaria pfeifferi]|uniref:Craniofacial development protein 2 n=1 Tax=Biomphalaria pfeifferi TaxID=112525 RepID=A0AAD8EWM6_BIOPF|nr:craniofacial development protein 2 [Biomphalaria pfeifferi]
MTSQNIVDKRIPLKVVCWNVRTLQDSNKCEYPQSRHWSPLVALQLARLEADIAALVRCACQIKGMLTEKGAVYTFYWSGSCSKEHRQTGMNFMIKQSLAKKL